MDALAMSVTKLPFPLNLSAKTFTHYSHVPNKTTDCTIFMTITQLYNNLLIENKNKLITGLHHLGFKQ